MTIKKVTWQHRNDFRAILECEHCQSEQNLNTGYDDNYYHGKVIPSITCAVCKKDRAGKVTDQDSQGLKSV